MFSLKMRCSVNIVAYLCFRWQEKELKTGYSIVGWFRMKPAYKCLYKYTATLDERLVTHINYQLDLFL